MEIQQHITIINKTEALPMFLTPIANWNGVSVTIILQERERVSVLFTVWIFIES
ncbi:hypothetical protein HanPSC8_Chr14g0630591 [Helianthus annuus]|nr:hypothetical protein HanPSC8_Chr14g0630591 [Helianthus annuus]